MRVGIVGAGLVGRLLAWHLCQEGVSVWLFDKDEHNLSACSLVAAGMISPIAERPILSEKAYQLGLYSLSLWPKILKSLLLPVFYKDEGSLVVTHISQKALLCHFIAMIQSKQADISLSLLNKEALKTYEPEINDFVGCYLPNEAWIEPKSLFEALKRYLYHYPIHGVFGQKVERISASQVITSQGVFDVDRVIDCRGLGAQKDLPRLRGVRGEIIECIAKEVYFSRPIRVLHARFPCYIVPREKHHFVIGATQIESEETAAMTAQSAVELLSVAMNVHPGFANAHIIRMDVSCRPTLWEEEAWIQEREGIIYINGMFRHGYLLAPAITHKVAQILCKNK